MNQCPFIEYICMNSKVYCRHYCISTLLCSRGSTISYISNGYTLMEEADIRESWQGLGRDWLNINMFKYLISSDVILRFITMFEPFRDLNLYSFGKIILSWFVMLVIWKRVCSISSRPNHAGNKIQAKFGFLLKLLSISLLKLGFSD